MKLPIETISFTKIRRQSFYLWIRHYKLLFVLCFLCLTGFASYQWYTNLYHYSWSSEERRVYLESTAKETVFQEEKFLDVLKRLETDRAERLQPQLFEHNLFEGARKKE